MRVYAATREMSESHWRFGHLAKPRKLHFVRFYVARGHSDPAQWHQFRVSPLIFMKIKSGEWKHVYERRKERFKDDCLDGERAPNAPIRIVDYLRLERKLGRRFSVLRAE